MSWRIAGLLSLCCSSTCFSEWICLSICCRTQRCLTIGFKLYSSCSWAAGLLLLSLSTNHGPLQVSWDVSVYIDWAGWTSEGKNNCTWEKKNSRRRRVKMEMQDQHEIKESGKNTKKKIHVVSVVLLCGYYVPVVLSVYRLSCCRTWSCFCFLLFIFPLGSPLRRRGWSAMTLYLNRKRMSRAVRVEVCHMFFSL